MTLLIVNGYKYVLVWQISKTPNRLLQNQLQEETRVAENG